MSRFLLVTLPLSGHVHPALAVARALADQGHEVAWAGPEGFLRPLVGPDAVVYPTGLRPYRGQRDLGARALKAVWEGFVVPYAKFTLRAVDAAVRDYQPDAVVVDQHACAGALAAHRHGVAWATLAPSAMELTRPFRDRPAIEAWIHRNLASLWAAADLPGEPAVDLRFSPHLVVALTTTALTGPVPFPDHYALVGPALAERPLEPAMVRPELAPDRTRVLITVGTIAQDLATGFHERMLEALEPLRDRVQAIIVSAPASVPPVPDHVRVVPRVPMLEVLPHLDAVVCHGGMNTACESLAHGVPLVVAPIKNDQPIIAEQVARSGAGIRVSFHRTRPAALRAAVRAVTDDPSYRDAAGRIQASFAAAGGAAAAAKRLAELAARSAGPSLTP